MTRDEIRKLENYMRDREVVCLTSAEHVLLDRHGHWLAALASGQFEPESSLGLQFTDTTRGVRPAQTGAEIAWQKLQASDSARKIVGAIEEGSFSALSDLSPTSSPLLTSALREWIQRRLSAVSDRDTRSNLCRAQTKLIERTTGTRIPDGGSVVNFGGLHDFQTWDW